MYPLDKTSLAAAAPSPPAPPPPPPLAAKAARDPVVASCVWVWGVGKGVYVGGGSLRLFRGKKHEMIAIREGGDSSQSEIKYFTETCSSSETGS